VKLVQGFSNLDFKPFITVVAWMLRAFARVGFVVAPLKVTCPFCPSVLSVTRNDDPPTVVLPLKSTTL